MIVRPAERGHIELIEVFATCNEFAVVSGDFAQLYDA